MCQMCSMCDDITLQYLKNYLIKINYSNYYNDIIYLIRKTEIIQEINFIDKLFSYL